MGSGQAARVVVSWVVLGAVSATGVGQVLLPPPSKPEGFVNKKWVPEFQRTENLQLREALERFQREKMADQERRDREREAERRRRQQLVNSQYYRETMMEAVGGIPFDSLAWRGEDGRVVPLDMPPFYAALNHNPLLDQASLDSAWMVLNERQKALRALVVEHADVIEMIEAGELERLSVADFNELQRVRQMLKRIDLDSSPEEDLFARGVLDDRQVFLNGLIVKDYQDAVRRDMAETGAATNPQLLLVPMLRSQAAEGLYAYETMLMDASNDLASAAGTLTLSDGQKRVLEEAIAGLERTTERSERLRIMSTFVRTLETAQLRAFLASIAD